MSTQTYYFSGEVRWAKLYKPDEKYGKYSIDIKLEGEDLETFKALGLKNGVKEGGWVSLRRDPLKKIWKNGEQVVLGAPLVLDGTDKPTKDLIGNGSMCTVAFVVNEFTSKAWGKVKSSWIDTVRVDKLVKYDGGNLEGVKVPTESSDSVKPRMPW